MREQIKWLMKIELMAGNLYRDAAVFFEQDEGLSNFLHNLADDEAWHFHIMEGAAEYIRTHPEVKPLDFILDDETRGKIDAIFRQNLQELKNGRLTKHFILECIGTTESSEWNDLFLYVVNSLKEESREYQHIAARMQDHLQHIQNFLESRPEGIPLLDKIRRMPRVWQDKILIVEDSQPLLEILEAVFDRNYMTATADNGRTGLEKIKENYFDVIISDIKMPEMDGIKMYQEALRYDPGIGSRFLFFSGYLTEEHKDFLHEHKIPSVLKPGSMDDLNGKIQAILQENRNRNTPERL